MSEDKLWFKRKRWGYGWSPNTVRGWSLTFAYLLVISALSIAFASQDELNIYFSFAIGVLVIVITVTFFFITLRHAPPPAWQWGEYNKKEK
jgi:hypothetical protein